MARKQTFELFEATTTAGAELYRKFKDILQTDEIVKELLTKQGVRPENLTLDGMKAILKTRDEILKKPLAHPVDLEE